MIVLDTHVLLWWVNGDKALSPKARATLEGTIKIEGSMLISSISVWELAMLIEKKRLILSMDLKSWVEVIQKIPAIQFVPVDNEIAIHSTQLPGEFHPDPADRIIVALARKHAFPLITADQKIRNYPYVKTVW